MSNKIDVTCSKCKSSYKISFKLASQKFHYCCVCGSTIPLTESKSDSGSAISESSLNHSSATLVPGHRPEKESVKFVLDSFQIINEVGKGGMGEVFLAYDTDCGRRIALKRIRTDLNQYPQMHNRFLKEARITSQLTHPSIIPIYTIYAKDKSSYYTMPYVEGKNLKQLLRELKSSEKKGHKSDDSGNSIPHLVRIFLNVCQAIAYAHSKGVLHRDIKPENIILGQFGEVLILDWGLAKLVEGSKSTEEEMYIPTPQTPHHITRLGKVVGTVSYMAPERALGNPATIQTDIYSLGVILYQILSLRLPFKRGTLQEFREKIHLEELYDPIEVSPYRDVPKVLSRITFKCLSKTPAERYNSVQELIYDIESYIEGRSEWFLAAQLDIFNKQDWEFQENVLIAEHMAITHSPEISEWVNLMVSKSSFNETLMLEASVKLGDKGHGIGFLLGIPEASQRVHLNDGFCLWIGSESNRSTKLLCSTVEVIYSPDVFLQNQEWYRLRIEKIGNKLSFFINDSLQFSYTSYLPVVGTHVGLLSRDADFMIKDFVLSIGSQNVMVNCLAVPDAFLAKKDYTGALSEYRRIGQSFPGRAEGREAMFRAGITLLEQAKASSNNQQASSLYEQALKEFEKLYKTSGAPLEYLGKALIYQTLNDNDEEVKCYELAFRRYPKHPLLPILKEQILYRMHTSSRSNRLATYRFVLLVLRHMPDLLQNWNVKKLFISLKKHWELLPFIIDDAQIGSDPEWEKFHLSTILAFWLNKPYIVIEVLDDFLKLNRINTGVLTNILFALIEMGAVATVKQKLEEIQHISSQISLDYALRFVDIALLASSSESFTSAIAAFIGTVDEKILDADQERSLLLLLKQAIRFGFIEKVPEIIHSLIERGVSFSHEIKTACDSYGLWSFLLAKQWSEAEKIINQYTYEDLIHESSLMHFLYGCWLYVAESEEIASAYFRGSIEITHPRTWMLFNYFYNGRISLESGWIQKAFTWEKRQLYLQLSLYHECLGDHDKSLYFKELEKNELIQL